MLGVAVGITGIGIGRAFKGLAKGVQPKSKGIVLRKGE